jgi:hypothetical protein
MQQETLGLLPIRVKAVSRALIEGRIVEAYGSDLAPIPAKYTESVQLAREAKEERDTLRRFLQ